MRSGKSILTIICLVLLGLVHAFMFSLPAGGQASPATAKSPAESEIIWGPKAGNLRISIVVPGEVIQRGAFSPAIRLKNCSDQPVRLARNKDVFAWLLVSQKALDGSMRVIFTDKVFVVLTSTDWPTELAPGQTYIIKPTDFSASAVYPFAEDMIYRDGFPVTMPAAQPDTWIPSLGRFAESTSLGLTNCQLMLCLPGMADAEPAKSNAVGVLISPADLKILTNVERGIFLADLMRQFDGGDEAAVSASRTTIRLGSQAILELVATAKDSRHSGEAKKWIVKTLVEISDERTVEPLIGFLDDSNADVKLCAAYRGPRQQSERLDKTIIEKALAGDEQFRAMAMLGFLIFRGQAPQKLLEAGLDSTNSTVRASALAALQDAAPGTDMPRLRQLAESTDHVVAKTARQIIQTRKIVDNNWTDDGKYTVLLKVFYGDNNRSVCEAFQQRLVVDTGWDKTFVLSTKENNASYLCWGLFPTVQAAGKCLEKARAYRTPSGMALFEKAEVIEPPSSRSTMPASE